MFPSSSRCCCGSYQPPDRRSYETTIIQFYMYNETATAAIERRGNILPYVCGWVGRLAGSLHGRVLLRWAEWGNDSNTSPDLLIKRVPCTPLMIIHHFVAEELFQLNRQFATAVALPRPPPNLINDHRGTMKVPILSVGHSLIGCYK